MNKVIVTAAITGSIHTSSMSPHLPITPEQIAEEAIRVFGAGGTVAHVHVRDPETGVPTAPQNLNFLVETARSAIGDFEFSVCGAGKMQFAFCTQSLILGGHARVGLEDNLYLEKGVMAKSNAEQVAKIIRSARELGLEPASPAEGRNILSLKGLERVNF
jgi:uncharacterized protein (DUF849 family)